MKIFKIIIILILTVCFSSCNLFFNQDSFDVSKFSKKISNTAYEEEITRKTINLKINDIYQITPTDKENFRLIVDSMNKIENIYEIPRIIDSPMVNYDIKSNSFNVLSITLESVVYNYSGVPVSYMNSYNLYDENFSLLRLSDVLSSEGIEIINQQINTNMYHKILNNRLTNTDIRVSKNTFNVLNAIFYFEDNNLIFMFPEFFFEKSTTIPTFIFKKEDIKNLLKI